MTSITEGIISFISWIYTKLTSVSVYTTVRVFYTFLISIATLILMYLVLSIVIRSVVSIVFKQ